MFSNSASETTPVRERILQVARSLFANEGYHHTSTIAIARAAGTSETQLLKKFGNKQGLLESIFDDDWAVIADTLRRIAASGLPPLDRLRSLIHAVVEHVDRNPEMKKLLVLELGRVRGKPGKEVLVPRSYIESSAMVAAIFEEARRAGRLRGDVQPQTLCSSLFGMMSRLWWDQLRTPDDPAFSSAQLLAMVEIFLSSITLTAASARNGCN